METEFSMSVFYSNERLELLIPEEDFNQKDEIDAKSNGEYQLQQPHITPQERQQQLTANQNVELPITTNQNTVSNNTTATTNSTGNVGSRRTRSRKKSHHFRSKTGEPLTVDFILAAKNNNLNGVGGVHQHDALNATSSSSSLKKQEELTNIRKLYFRNLKKKQLKISRPFFSQVWNVNINNNKWVFSQPPIKRGFKRSAHSFQSLRWSVKSLSRFLNKARSALLPFG